MKTIVTAGAKGVDIDVFACAVAYSELLNLEGGESTPVVVGEFTMSVTPSILAWGAKYESECMPDGSEQFVLVDISDPEHIPSFVDIERITEVYDHRYGHEEFWKERISNDSHIEMVGSCGTLIWEEFKKRDKLKEISTTSAKLLLASIVSNTLNFKSSLVTERDRSAYSELSSITGLSNEWIEKYFREQEEILLKDFKKYLETDTKQFKLGSEEFVIGQIELWNADDIFEAKKDDIHQVMQRYEPIPWMVNISNISKGFNYIYSEHLEAQRKLEEVLGIQFENGTAKTKKLLMRKHIMKLLRESYN